MQLDQASSAPRPRHYDPSDLKALMENADAVRDWDDLIDYLEGPARREAGLSPVELPEIIDDVRRLKDNDVRFTRDYHALWQEIVEHKADAQSGGNEDSAHRASSRVMDVLQRVQSQEYREMAGLNETRNSRYNRH